MLASDGTCRSFDSSGSGYVRSEAVVAIYLQRAPDARRVYATLVHSKNNCDGNKDNGMFKLTWIIFKIISFGLTIYHRLIMWSIV